MLCLLLTDGLKHDEEEEKEEEEEGFAQQWLSRKRICSMEADDAEPLALWDI